MLHVLLLVLDIGGTFVFAISGAMVAVQRRLDIFGVLVLSFAAGNAGGITRDLLIGAVPPSAIADWKYIGVTSLAGVITFLWYPTTNKLRRDMLWFDAVGLCFFAVVGTQKALSHGIAPIPSALLGMLTGVGGGILRDILITEVPVVLRADLYASAALAGACVVAVAPLIGLPSATAMVAGGLLCFALRFMAIRHHWRLPEARSRGE